MNGKTIKNSIFNIFKTLGSLLFPIVTFSYASRIFLTEGMGRINFANSVVAIFAIFAKLGINQYGIRECVRKKGDKPALSKLFCEIVAINLISAMITFIALLIFTWKNQMAHEYRHEILLYGMTIFLGVFGFDWLYEAYEDYKYIAVRSLIIQFISLILVLLLVHRREDLYVYISIQVIASAGANLFGLYHAKKYVSYSKVAFSALSKHVHSILNLFLVTLFLKIFTDMDTVMLRFLSSEREVGLYSASYKISTVLCGMITAATTVILPRVADAFFRNNNDKANEIIKLAIQSILFIGLPLSIGSCIFAEKFILILGGEDFHKAAISARILALRTFLSPINAMLLLHYLIPKKKEKEAIIISAIAAASNVVLNYFLIPLHGAVGASLAIVAAEAIEFVFLFFYIRKYMSFKYAFSGISQYCLCVIPVVFIAYCASKIIRNNYISITAGVLLSVPCYLLLLWMMRNQFVMYGINMIREVSETSEIS